MRRAALLRTLGLLCCLALAAIAFAAPRFLALAREGETCGAGCLAAAVLATGLAIKVAGPLSIFGLHGRLGGSLLAAVSALFLAWGAVRGRFPKAAEPAPTPAKPRPYALPARVAVALEAAARARR
jgi:hypothetical protein